MSGMLLRSVVTIALVAMSTACFGEDAAAGGRSHNVYLNLFGTSISPLKWRADPFKKLYIRQLLVPKC